MDEFCDELITLVRMNKGSNTVLLVGDLVQKMDNLVHQNFVWVGVHRRQWIMQELRSIVE